MSLSKLDKLYSKSIQVLKQIQLPNGGCLASPPGQRYPYIYPRDHALVSLAFNSAGMLEEARRAIDFIFSYQKKDGSFPQRVSKKGKDKSYKPIQLDNTGLILYSTVQYYKKTGKLLHKNKIRKAVKYIEKQFDKKHSLLFTPNSIWEFSPYEEGLEIWANTTCCAALLELEKIGIKSIGKQVKKGILEYLWSGEKNYFIKNIRLKESSSVVDDIDAAAYSVGDFGILKDNDKRVKSTVKAIEKYLWHPKLGGICRYKKYIGRNNGGYGPWPWTTLALCRHFIKTGQKSKAQKYLNWVVKISYNNLLPEHIATKESFETYVHEYKEAGILRKDRKIMIKNIRKQPMYKRGLAYSVLPLSVSHAEFVRTYNLFKKRFEE